MQVGEITHWPLRPCEGPRDHSDVLQGLAPNVRWREDPAVQDHDARGRTVAMSRAGPERVARVRHARARRTRAGELVYRAPHFVVDKFLGRRLSTRSREGRGPQPLAPHIPFERFSAYKG